MTSHNAEDTNGITTKRFGRLRSFARKKMPSSLSSAPQETTSMKKIKPIQHAQLLQQQNHKNKSANDLTIMRDSKNIIIHRNNSFSNNNNNNNNKNPLFGTSPTSVATASFLGKKESETETDDASSCSTSEDDSVHSMISYDTNDPLQNWFKSTNALLTSTEMTNFTLSSRDLICTGAFVTFKFVTLPITIPMNAVSLSTSFACGTCVKVSSTILRGLSFDDHVGESTSSSSSSSSLVGTLVGNVSKIIPITCNVANHIKNEVLTLVAPGVFNDSTSQLQNYYSRRYVPVPSLHQQQRRSQLTLQSTAGESTAEEDDDFLDRLKFDDYSTASSSSLEDEEEEDDEDDVEVTKALLLQETFKKNTNKKSEYLLHVGDIGVYEKSSLSLRMSHVDLKNPTIGGCDQEESYLDQTLDTLAINALHLFSDHGECQQISSSSISDGNIHVDTNIKPEVLPVQWKPEGSTQKLLRKKNKKMLASEWKKVMEREVLVWSGSFIGGTGRQFPLFLARSIVPGSPKDLLRLLWDNDRVSVYNKFNLGRTDMLVIEDNILSTSIANEKSLRGTKVIKSETSVPFTKLSVTISALMYARPIFNSNTGSLEGYMIISRTLNRGVAGCHVIPTKKRRQRKSQHNNHHNHHHHSDNDFIDEGNNNEIMWGINVMKSIPNEPNKTEFSSLSHVATGLVPGFIGRKIGMMGIDDFYSAIKKLKY